MTVQDVLTLRVTLLHGGYSPLPLVGKAPALKEWQKRVDTSEGDIRIWSKVYPAAANTGILTRLTPALDLDLLNADAAAAAEEFVRERYEEAGYVLTRIGRAPKRSSVNAAAMASAIGSMSVASVASRSHDRRPRRSRQTA